MQEHLITRCFLHCPLTTHTDSINEWVERRKCWLLCTRSEQENCKGTMHTTGKASRHDKYALQCTGRVSIDETPIRTIYLYIPLSTPLTVALSDIVNTKLARKTALGSGLIVYGINAYHNTFLDSAAAGAKQAGITFVMSGVGTRLVEHCAMLPINRFVARGVATTVPPALTFLVSYVTHASMGTPRPFLSAVWNVPVNVVSAYIASGFYQRENEYTPQEKASAQYKTLRYMLRRDMFTNPNKE
jgi:hypothetical protein